LSVFQSQLVDSSDKGGDVGAQPAEFSVLIGACLPEFDGGG
jgi:hypothetical protein